MGRHRLRLQEVNKDRIMQNRYILLTAAKNEEGYIGEALQLITRQTVPPLVWVIVDDGSTDQTAEIVREFATHYPFIQLQSAGQCSAQRSFGSKDKAINAAYAWACDLEFGFVGIQDADIAPERYDYYESMLREFQTHPKLGITGGYICERLNGIWKCRRGNSPDSVAGGIQLFRRACFEQIGGYVALHHGGEDWLAELNARMAGWEVFARPEHHVLHYRPSSSAGGRWQGLFREGMMDASFGSHPLFQLFKCARRIAAPPLVAGSMVRFCGYFWWNLTGRKPVIGPEQVGFLRREQLGKIRDVALPSRGKAPGQVKPAPAMRR